MSSSPGLTISRQTIASYAPIPINVGTDRGAWQLTLDGPSRNFRVPGNILRFLSIPPQFATMFLIKIVTPSGDCNFFEWDGEPLYVVAITIEDGFLWAPNAFIPPQCTFRPTYVGSSGFVFESGFSMLDTCPPGLPVRPNGVPFGAVGIPPVPPGVPVVGGPAPATYATNIVGGKK